MRTRAFVGGALLAGLASLAPPWAAAQSAAPTAAQSAWLQDPAVQQQLAAGQIVSRSALDAEQERASVDAAVLIHASPQAVWPLITQCKFAGLLIAGLKRCEELQSAPDGSWSITEHDIKYSLLTPMVHSVFRADYRVPHHVDFHRIAGDMKDETGSWDLQPSADGSVTIVEYQISMQPGFWVPRSMVRHSLRKQLPEALAALRTHAEQAAAASAPPASAPPVASALGAAAAAPAE